MPSDPEIQAKIKETLKVCDAAECKEGPLLKQLDHVRARHAHAREMLPRYARALKEAVRLLALPDDRLRPCRSRLACIESVQKILNGESEGSDG